MAKVLTKKDLLSALRQQVDRTTPEIDVLAEAVSALATQIASNVSRGSHVFTEIVSNMQSSLIRERVKRNSIRDYFTGNGPVAKMIKQYALIDRFTGIQPSVSAELKNFRTEQLLEDFVYAAAYQHDTLEVFNKWLADEVQDLVYADTLPPPVLKYEGNISITTPTGFYRLVEPGHPPRNALVLNTVLACSTDDDFEDARVVFVAASKVSPQLFYYHPYEDEWLSSGFSYFVGGTVLALQTEFDRAMARHKTLLQSRDWVGELEDFKKQADWIFDNRDQLPEHCDEFRKEGSGAQIEIEAAGHALTFCCSGDYVFRTHRLTQQHPQYRHVALVTSVDQMDIKDLNMLFYTTEHCLNKLKSKITQDTDAA